MVSASTVKIRCFLPLTEISISYEPMHKPEHEQTKVMLLTLQMTVVYAGWRTKWKLTPPPPPLTFSYKLRSASCCTTHAPATHQGVVSLNHCSEGNRIPKFNPRPNAIPNPKFLNHKPEPNINTNCNFYPYQIKPGANCRISRSARQICRQMNMNLTAEKNQRRQLRQSYQHIVENGMER